MNRKRWQEVRRVLDAALAYEGDARREEISRLCSSDADLRSEVESMIFAFEQGASRLEPATQTGFPPGPLERSSIAPPDRLGPYRLLEPIGHGGMATVYRARRDDDYRQEVALKILHSPGASDELMRRLRRERQILAGLDHPNIAKLLDGGTTGDDRPYLVLEFVRGEPIDRYCQRHGASLDQRLDLFLEVCEAVDFAHRHLVVHRDLKPSNILVTEDASVKLLDFGIAKLLQPETFPVTVHPTRTGLLPMTPEYASPEQVRGLPITTASDVYTLGVLLYVLLAGRHPYELDGRDLATVVETVCRREPPRPSTVAAASPHHPSPRALAGDLDAIVLTALAKSPEARYPSVGELARDLRRHRQGRPVQARAGTLRYRASRFVARHRLAVAGATAASIVLTGFLVVLLVQQQRILGERAQAVHQRHRAETVSEWMVDLFALPEPSRSLGERITARELLDKGAREIERSLTDDPALRADLMATMGRTYAKVGLLPEGIDLLERAAELRRAEESPGALASNLHHLAEARNSAGDYQAAATAAEESLALRRESRPEPPEVARTMALLAHVEDRMGRRETARQRLSQAEKLARRAGDPEVLTEVLQQLGALRWNLDDPDGARAAYNEALRLLRARHGDLHPRVALLTGSLAQATQGSDPETAERLFEEAIEDQKRLFGDEHPVLATALNNLGMLHYEHRRLDEATALLRQALTMQVELYGERHSKVASTRMNLGNVLAKAGDLDRAEAAYREALAVYADTVGPDHDRYALCLNNLGELILSRGQLEEAEPLLESALAITRTALGAEHRQNATILGSLGRAALARGDLDVAVARLEEAVSIAKSLPGEDHPSLGPILVNLGSALVRSNRPAEAADRFSDALAVFDRPGGEARMALRIRTQLASLQLELGRPDAAEPLARAAWEQWRRRSGPNDIWALSAQSLLWQALLRQKRYSEAQPLLLDGIGRLRTVQPASSSRLAEAEADLAELSSAIGGALAASGAEADPAAGTASATATADPGATARALRIADSATDRQR